MANTILVTGSAGFIGSHSCQKLLTKGYKVVGIDNLNDYYSPARKEANIEEVRKLPPGSDFTFLRLDIRDRKALTQLFQQHKFSSVVNLAAVAGVRVSIEDPHLYVETNLTGTLNLLLACVEHEVKNFVLASTSSAYGNTTTIPFVETDPCDRPLAPYAASKRAAEMMAYTYHHLFGINTTVLRFFTVYGPRSRPDMMAYKVLDNMFFDTPLTIYDQGEMWRDWTFIDDITDGITAAALNPLGYEIINLGRGEMIKLSDFIAILEGLTGRRIHAAHAPRMAADTPRSFADVSKARRLLGYDPKISVRDGIERFWKWYQEAVLENKKGLGISSLEH